jgi:hypothetical protein
VTYIAMATDSACPDDAAIRAKIDALWSRYLDLLLAKARADNAPPERRARDLETLRQSTSRLIEQAERELPERLPDESPEHSPTPRMRRAYLATFHQLRAMVYSRLRQREQCFADYERSLEYDPASNLHHYENCIHARIEFGEPLRAAEIANRAPFELWRTEECSVAGRVLRWAQENPPFAAALRPEVLVECQRLVDYGAGSSHLDAEAWSAFQRGGAERIEG